MLEKFKSTNDKSRVRKRQDEYLRDLNLKGYL
jgi:hypothetical protein